MKKVTKNSLLVSLGLILVGLVIVFFSLLAVGFNFGKFSSEKFELHTYDITGKFSVIHINELTDNIEVIKSDDDTGKIICYDSEKIYHKLLVGDVEYDIDESEIFKDDVLYFVCQDDREWYEKIFSFSPFKENTQMKIYLPESEYEEMQIYSTNGNITIPDNFDFDRLTMTSVNGKVDCRADVHQYLSTETTNGNINIQGKVNGKIHIDTVNGEITVPNIGHSEKADFGSTNRDININGNVIGQLYIHSVNGGVDFGKLQSDNIKISTVNGDITGTVLSDKTFQASSVNGGVSVPNQVEHNGDFIFESVNGNIDINNQ